MRERHGARVELDEATVPIGAVQEANERPRHGMKLRDRPARDRRETERGAFGIARLH